MARIAQSITDLIGRTPLLELRGLAAAESLTAHLVAKLEFFNPAGSVKDRVALSMIDDLERRGTIACGSTLIEPTSGNTGIGLAAIAAARGYSLILTMPETMSLERRRLLAALGAQLELTDGAQGMSGAIARAEELHAQIEGSVILNQFANPANPSAHYCTTADEVWEDCDGHVDIVVAGVGTGGTVSGVGRRLRELNPAIQIVGVEPAASPMISQGVKGAHKIQGIGAGFIPANYCSAVVDRIMTVENEAAFEAARLVAKHEGVLVGISGGAAIWAAMEIARESENYGKRIVVIVPDGGERYLTTELFEK